MERGDGGQEGAQCKEAHFPPVTSEVGLNPGGSHSYEQVNPFQTAAENPRARKHIRNLSDCSFSDENQIVFLNSGLTNKKETDLLNLLSGTDPTLEQVELRANIFVHWHHILVLQPRTFLFLSAS